MIGWTPSMPASQPCGVCEENPNYMQPYCVVCVFLCLPLSHFLLFTTLLPADLPPLPTRQLSSPPPHTFSVFVCHLTRARTRTSGWLAVSALAAHCTMGGFEREGQDPTEKLWNRQISNFLHLPYLPFLPGFFKLLWQQGSHPRHVCPCVCILCVCEDLPCLLLLHYLHTHLPASPS